MIRLPSRRLVNVGSVGDPLDGDRRACFVLAVPNGDGWHAETRRVAYDIEATIAAYDDELRAVDPAFVALMSRELRAARSYLGPWFRSIEGRPDEELDAALRRFLDEHP